MIVVVGGGITGLSAARKLAQDGFDVLNWVENPDGTFTRQFNLGGLDQNIYGNTITIP